MAAELSGRGSTAGFGERRAGFVWIADAARQWSCSLQLRCSSAANPLEPGHARDPIRCRPGVPGPPAGSCPGDPGSRAWLQYTPSPTIRRGAPALRSRLLPIGRIQSPQVLFFCLTIEFSFFVFVLFLLLLVLPKALFPVLF